MTFRTKLVIVLISMCIAGVIGTYCWVNSFAYRTEQTLSATCFAAIVVEKYVCARGSWPSSWQELESVTATYGTLYSWPRDAATVRSYVEIDFDSTLDELTRKDVEDFTAIRPRYATYRSYQDCIAQLLRTMRQVKKTRNIDVVWSEISRAT